MDQPTKKQKVGDSTSIYSKEEVLFSTDTLSKIISYLPSCDLLSLALTCKRFGVSSEDGKLSLIEESARLMVQEIATEEELATLPYYNGENSLANYRCLQLMRGPLAFDQLAIGAEYVKSEDKSCIRHGNCTAWSAAFSNNIMRAGKHYVSFTPSMIGENVSFGVMRPGEINQWARGHPVAKFFYHNFSQRLGYGECSNYGNVQCCMYYAFSGDSQSSDWRGSIDSETWDGMEGISFGDELGMLLNLDEGSLSVYKNGRKLGIMKMGLAGPYCWVVSMRSGAQISIKRGTIPPS